ncbi:MAG: hypothetical protein ABI306_02480 [Caulobacteraceae bacterium]
MFPPASHASPIHRAQGLYKDRQFAAALEVVDAALADPAAGRRVDLLSLKARLLFANLGRTAEGLQAIEAAWRLAPDAPAVLRLLARLRQAAGPSAGAFSAYKRLFKSGDKAGGAAEGLFSILVRRKRYRVATALAPMVATAEPMAGALALDLADLALARRDVDGAAAMIERARTALGERAVVSPAAIARSMKAELQAGDTMAGYRHLAIAGMAFCGSTTLGVILGSMPLFAFAGETHWLTNTRDGAGQTHPIKGTKVPQVQWPIACRVCGRTCQYFDPPFRVALADDETGWYAKIADRLGVKNLVTADKNIHFYQQRDPLSRFDYILSFKTPASYLRSMLKQQLRQPDGAATADPAWAAGALDRWADNHLAHLRTIRPAGRRVVLSWDGFVADPDRHLRRLSALLDVPLGPETLTRIRLGHFIGGNTGLDIAALRTDPTLVLRPSNAPALPPDLQAAVLAHRASQAVARKLEVEYRRDFGER